MLERGGECGLVGRLALCLLLTALSVSRGSDMSEGSFGSHARGKLAAFGDFNSDELTDVFVIANQSWLQIYLAYDKEPLLRPAPEFACELRGAVITSVVPGDFDGDAFMDVLLTTAPVSDPAAELQHVRVLWGGRPTLECSDADTVKAITRGQPLVLDHDKDMILDLFGVDEKSERKYWIFDKSRGTPREFPMGNETRAATKLPHSHGFLDFNGDNFADLMVSNPLGVEIWLGGKPPGFVYYKSLLMLVGSPIFGQALFLDIALTGEFFMIVPTCFDLECRNSSLLVYNERAAGDKPWLDLKVNFNKASGETWRLVPPRSEAYLDTMTMRSGDFNMDGYPDILLTLCPENSNDTYVFLLKNELCDFPECEFHRTYEVQWDKFPNFGKNTVLATFYDFYNDGILDIIYIKKNVTSNDYTMHAFKNELQYDANFIKVIVLTGLTNERPPQMYGSFRKKKGTYGTNLPGPKISYSTLTQEGNYRTGVCAQLPQSAYFALQLPYSIFGLDRTPNFVNSLMVGLSGYLKTWTQIIPNSQMVVVPYPPSDPSQWRAQLFVTPSKLVLKSVLVLTAIIVMIIASVLFLHWRERHDRQDIIEINENTYVKI